ncbi:Eukaryotic translation initiation factor 2A [Taphrina deformans PYCC 5710]|uniref:Eukaryotic translation initiation factor 2A n=1 Tax=Taphrina deformans (strain PYCC 5710 / ATCC 11124 / CBS 356.35 / IMI 108563 / JCM 9778 / NBRC 8474) TaxID=1097556 RepID=R4X6H3_TAPDE|nr:Eukaryotic translation initiation factor 2A [Taphrina deformans PYCC 5710]|eukprot:CCG80719.1 Eukaryotic translation initiation factor 2A [Taphrina deformans PYCC 5710]
MSTQFAYRTGKTIGITDAYPSYTPREGFVQPTGNLRCCAYGPSGKLFAWATTTSVEIIETKTGSHLQSLPVTNCLEIGFSPEGTYIVTWERFVKLESGEGSKNLRVWTVAGGEETCAFTQKSQSGWNLQYTSDEALCARVVTNEIQFFDPADMSGGTVHKLRMEGVVDFALSPGKNRAVAVFVPERKGAPAAVRVFNIPSFQSPVSQKTFFKAEKVKLKWNELGTSLLCMTSTDVDKSNKSYYGENNLYLLGVAGNYDCRVALDKEGPVHDITWSPDSKEFGAIYGFMPAKITMFDARANITHSVPAAPRNTILFSPDSRLVIIAGFGNLQGTMDIYERNGMKKIATIDAANTSHCEWSPDSRHILTATTSPRLRVDNGIKIWHYKGQLVYTEDHQELFYATMRPQSVQDFPARAQSPGPEPHTSATAVAVEKPVSAPKGAYRPPHARGRPEETSTKHYFRDAEDGPTNGANSASYVAGANRQVPGATPAYVPGSSQRSVPGAPPGLNAAAGTFTSPVTQGNGATSAPTSSAPIEDRKIRNLAKKLRAIEDLRMRQAGGEKLEATQTQKIAAYDATLKELQALGWKDE